MSEFHLKASGYEVGVAPQFGAAVTYLKYKGSDYLRPVKALNALEEDPREAACFPCVPYFGRLYDGLTLNGRYFAQSPTLPTCDPTHALHGEGWVNEWAIVSQTKSVLVCSFHHDGTVSGRFPFAYEARQKIKLSKNGVEISLGLKNVGDKSMPAGLGLHPYLMRRTDTVCGFTAKQYWTPPAGHASGALSYLPDALGAARPTALPFSARDHSYAGFGGEVAISTGNLSLRLGSDAPILHLYAPEGEKWFCLEPVTHLPGVLVARDHPYGGKMLAPGDMISLSLSIVAS